MSSFVSKTNAKIFQTRRKFYLLTDEFMALHLNLIFFLTSGYGNSSFFLDASRQKLQAWKVESGRLDIFSNSVGRNSNSVGPTSDFKFPGSSEWPGEKSANLSGPPGYSLRLAKGLVTGVEP